MHGGPALFKQLELPGNILTIRLSVILPFSPTIGVFAGFGVYFR